MAVKPLLLSLLVWLLSSAVYAEAPVATRPVNIYSDGIRLSGDLFWPRGQHGPLPGIVLCHGWAGLKSHLNERLAPAFAEAGFVVLTFDYRGWGESDGRIVAAEPLPELDGKSQAEIRVTVVRESIDPPGQLADIRSAIDFLQGEPMVDPERLGLWGMSLGGGMVIWTAAHDARVRCVVGLVPALDVRAAMDRRGQLEQGRKERLQRSRGEIPQAPPTRPTFDFMPGTPMLDRMLDYTPLEEGTQIRIPLLLLDAEEDELIDATQNSQRLFQILRECETTVDYRVLPEATHFSVLKRHFDRATAPAVQWFQMYL